MAPSPVEELALLELERSNKGASKQRRDQINGEIGVMRDLLPLPESARQRLSQLQIMSLSCVFIRKCNILQKLFSATPGGSSDSPCDFSQSLTGFLLVTTRDGKLVYISENVTEYLGHSMVDMKTQGDSLFDIVDKRDHGTVRAQLLHGAGEVDPDKEVAFFCRMNMSRTLKRQAGFGDVKVMHVKGHFATVPGQDPGTEQQVFMAVCSPLITPDIKESLIQNNTMVFKSVHQLDMNFIELTENGEYHLGVTNEDICNKSWYSYLHPEDIYEAREKHVQLIKSRHEMGCMMTVRMVTSSNEIIWVNIVMHVRQALLSNSDDPVILCINQVISEKEAYQFKVQGQLFALYAARSPDFFFGTAFCAPIAQAVENVISQPSGIISQPFFSRQQPFDNSLTAQTTPYMQTPGTPNQASMFMKNGYQPNVGRQGHTDTLKALKRKIQENYTCKPPVKVARMVNSLAHRNTYSPQQETTPLPASFESNIYRNSFGPLVGGSDYHHGMGQGPMQVMYAHNLSTVMMSPKEKSYMPDVFPSKPMYEEKPLEQVVPDVSVPACYLTPEPSPVSSPEPPTKCESVHSVKDSKSIDPVLVAKHLCALKQRHITENPLTNPVGEPRKHLNPTGEPRKLLPSLDAFYVDSFFNDIDHVSLTREEEIILLQNIAKGKIIVKEEPIEQEACKKNHEPLANDFDIEEFLQFTEKPKEEVVKVKIESRTDDQQVMSFDNSPSPSSPYSTISTADEKFGSDDLSSFALTPESGFESDSLDDVLDPDCWDLESVKMDMSLTSIQPNLSTFRVNPVAHPEPELYQLKQLISSCTPSGVQDFTEDSQ